MNEDFCIREYQDRDKDKLINLYQKSFGPKKAQKFARRWKWEFLANPAKKTVACNNWVVEYQGQIVGHLGSRPALLKIKDKTIPCLWAVDLMVDHAYRRHGLAKRLYAKLESLGAPAYFMIGLSIPAAKIAKARGWQECYAEPTMLKIINLKGLKSFILSREKFHLSFSWLMLVSGIFLGLLLSSVKLNIFKQNYRDLVVNSPGGFDERFNRFWKEIAQDYPIIFVRGAGTLNWRLKDNPNYRYKIFIAEKQKKITGYIVSCIEHKNGFNEGYIVDFITLAQAKDSAELLAKETINYFKSSGVDIIVCTGLAKMQRGILKKQGFISNFLIQKHLRPRFFFKVVDKLINKKQAQNPNNWFISNLNYDIFM